ncbi:MAG: dTDP-4-dehydrorhamnose reductase [Acidaminococcaceae bacterium]|nr:dTDP-4-dehydrorhamnose reductase [Acidaminococcaceae bacterium]
MKILVTGVAGQLGYDVMRELKKRGIETIGVDRSDFDITDIEATEKFILSVNLDAVIHCAAYTAVDAAEDNVELCRKVNVNGTENIARACAKIKAKMLYISTDYVFPGSGDIPYDINAEKAPQNVYGQSKLDGELVVQKYLQNYFIVRISWAFGKNGNNFVKTMLRLGKEREQLSVVSDQIGSPTYTFDLARLLVDMIRTDKYGIYHATNEGYCSWAEFAKEIMRLANLPCKIISISAAEYPTKAKRPLNSRMNKSSLDKNGFVRLPSWQDALVRYLRELNEQ